jgi:hypothetical protein
MEVKCRHIDLIKIDHWWFRLKCKKCGKRFRWLPSDDYFEININ